MSDLQFSVTYPSIPTRVEVGAFAAVLAVYIPFFTKFLADEFLPVGLRKGYLLAAAVESGTVLGFPTYTSRGISAELGEVAKPNDPTTVCDYLDYTTGVDNWSDPGGGLWSTDSWFAYLSQDPNVGTRRGDITAELGTPPQTVEFSSTIPGDSVPKAFEIFGTFPGNVVPPGNAPLEKLPSLLIVSDYETGEIIFSQVVNASGFKVGTGLSTPHVDCLAKYVDAGNRPVLPAGLGRAYVIRMYGSGLEAFDRAYGHASSIPVT